MARRYLLSSTERLQFTDFWAHMDEREFVRHYTLTENDLVVIQRKRRVQNRFGFAVLLCYLRFPGRPLKRDEIAPEPLVQFVAEQIHAEAKAMKYYGRLREPTRG